MKKLFLLPLLLICICISIQAQFQYQTTLWFETANGTRDSVVIGNHPDATQGVDTLLGEIAMDKDSVGFVWASKYSSYTVDRNTFLKKQLVAKDTSNSSAWKYSPIAISYNWDSLPLSIYWDEDFFKNDSVKSTMFSSVELFDLYEYTFEPFYHRITLWGRVGQLPNGFALQKDSALRYDYSNRWWNRYGNDFWTWEYDSYSSSLDSMKNFIFVTFGSVWDDSGFAAIDEIEDSSNMSVLVNCGTINIKNEDDAVMSNVYIYSTEGSVVMQQIGIGCSETTINTSRLPKGVYVVVADTKQGQRKQKVAI